MAKEGFHKDIQSMLINYRQQDNLKNAVEVYRKMLSGT
jgi:hypothetical protein